MGTYMQAVVQLETPDGWKYIDNAFHNIQSYSIYGFLAGVRNISAVRSIAPRRGLPEDIDESHKEHVESVANNPFGSHYDLYEEVEGVEINYDYAFGYTWVLLSELLAVDYDEVIEDRRDQGDTLPEGKGRKMTLREFLGVNYFSELERMKLIGPPERVRMVMWFT